MNEWKGEKKFNKYNFRWQKNGKFNEWMNECLTSVILEKKNSSFSLECHHSL